MNLGGRGEAHPLRPRVRRHVSGDGNAGGRDNAPVGKP